MKKEIYHASWHKLSGEEIVGLFDQHFSDVEIQPNLEIVNELRRLNMATLELLEDRTASSVYRIRQTGVVWQICQPDGQTFDYDDYEQYLQAELLDKLIRAFVPKPLKFTALTINGELIVKHHEPPQFSATWIGGMEGVKDVQWHNGQPSNFMEIPRLMQKLGAFMNTYFKQNGKEKK